MFIASNGVVQVEPNRTFRVLIANFGVHSYRLAKNEVVAILIPHPTAVVPTSICLLEILRIVNEKGEIPEATTRDLHFSANTKSAAEEHVPEVM